MQGEQSLSISVVINTKNAADTLERTLHSVEFSDEIVVVDMQSTDQTVEIARRYTQRIFEHDDVGYVEPARAYALEQAMYDWILLVDADEVVTAELRELLPRLVEERGNETVAFQLPRKNMIFGEWIQHAGWWPDYQLRFFKNGAVEWPREIHAQPVVKGLVETMEAQERYALQHFNYDDLSDFVQRMERYTTIQAAEIAEQREQRAVRSPAQGWMNEFLQRYFALGGWRDGAHGMAVSLLQASYEMIVQLKVWEARGSAARRPQEDIAALERAARDLEYWIADWHVQHSSGLQQLWWKLRRKLRM